jgi:hypothetical protein
MNEEAYPEDYPGQKKITGTNLHPFIQRQGIKNIVNLPNQFRVNLKSIMNVNISNSLNAIL